MRLMKHALTLFICLLLMSCEAEKAQKEQESDTMSEPEATIPAITKAPFGTMPDGTEIEKFTVEAPDGAKVDIITYGGIVTSLMVPDKDGNLGDVVLGHNSLQPYLDDNPFFGAIIGRYGNRIAKGKFSLDGEAYTLATNNDQNHLHGGEKGFDKVVWQGKEVQTEEAAGVELTYTSPDGEEGYPGTLDVKVTYLFYPDHTLEILYEAETDKRTIVNLTNHSYFNLGSDSTILDHRLMLNASQYLPVDNTLIPTGELKQVEGTPFDFTELQPIGEYINAENEQIARGGGYDHCWVLNSDSYSTVAARVQEPQSGRVMEVYTTEPGIQFYSGNFLDGSITGKDGTPYVYRSGFCLETQHFPDSPNQPGFPSVVLEPGETYRTKTKYTFGTL
ncbi:aldose epimerase family protein [Roseivirga sp. BDSF3-8]|uniref:aldose epimerase family protein n=1 Tax=Roseivirga sp. BDSF3-8 TaxID=3241598 RepID=UPI0035325C0C